MSALGWLSCPACGEDAIPSSSVGCTTCGGDERSGHFGRGCSGKMEPLWSEDDGGPCPGCGIALRVSVDDGGAWVSEVEVDLDRMPEPPR